MQKTKPILIIVVVCAVTLAATGAMLWKKEAAAPKISPDADAITLTQFLTSSEYHNLSLHNRKPYAKAIREKLPQAADAFKAGKLTKDQYDAAYLNAWMARQIDRMKDYYAQPSSNRDQFLLDQHRNKDKSSGSHLAQPDDAAEEKFVKEWVSHFKPEEKTEWDTFRAANKSAKQKLAGK